jgi:hypothetical protein
MLRATRGAAATRARRSRRLQLQDRGNRRIVTVERPEKNVRFLSDAGKHRGRLCVSRSADGGKFSVPENFTNHDAVELLLKCGFFRGSGNRCDPRSQSRKASLLIGDRVLRMIEEVLPKYLRVEQRPTRQQRRYQAGGDASLVKHRSGAFSHTLPSSAIRPTGGIAPQLRPSRLIALKWRAAGAARTQTSQT